jgi:hypothetical protein
MDVSKFLKDTFTLKQQTVDPRRRHTGTSYDAGGTIDPDSGVMKEQGSSRGGIIRDIVPALASRQQASIIYEEMVNGDTAVDISLRAAKSPFSVLTTLSRRLTRVTKQRILLNS